MTKNEADVEVVGSKKRANVETEETDHQQKGNEQDITESNADNPFRSKDKPPKKKFKKSVTNATEEPPAVQENDDEQVISVEGQLTTKPVLSKRQKKKLKKLQHHDKNKEKEVETIIAYLTKWNTNRDEWKYEKLKQIFIQKNVFNDQIIPDEHSEVAINYLTSSKGAARSVIIEKAEEVIRDIEDKLTEENQEELIASSSYKRARELIQLMSK